MPRKRKRGRPRKNQVPKGLKEYQERQRRAKRHAAGRLGHKLATAFLPSEVVPFSTGTDFREPHPDYKEEELPIDDTFDELPDILDLDEPVEEEKKEPVEEEKKESFESLLDRLIEKKDTIIKETRPYQAKTRSPSNYLLAELDKWIKQYTERTEEVGKTELEKLEFVVQLAFAYDKEYPSRSGIISEKLASVIKFTYSNLNTQSKAFTRIKKLFFSLLKVEDEKDEKSRVIRANIGKIFTVGQEARKGMNEEAMKKMQKRHSNIISIDRAEVYDFLQDNKESKDWKQLLIVAGLATGCRLIEIIKMSAFEQTENEFWLKQIGVAKDKKAIAGGEPRTVIKPIIGGIETWKMIDIIKNVREGIENEYKFKIEDQDNEELSKRISAKMRDLVKPLFGGWEHSFHSLRGLYAEMAYLTFPPSHEKTKTKFFSEILGHAEENITSAMWYERFHVGNIQRPPTVESAIQTLGIKVDKLEDIMRRENVFPKLEKGEVEFINGEGKKIVLLRQPNKHDKKEGYRLRRQRDHRTQLIENNIGITYRNLQRLGYGTSIIRDYNLWELQGTLGFRMEFDTTPTKEQLAEFLAEEARTETISV